MQKLRILISLILFMGAVINCSPKSSNYHDNSGRDDVLSGGVKMIPVTTPKGTFRVWTKRTGNNPTVKVLLLHGGPGLTHEYLEAFDSYFPGAEIEYYYYDQLGSYYSDQPEDPSLWDLDRFVDEVEQVRKALGLNKENFFLYGHSWGGTLAIEYALKYQENLKGVILSASMSSSKSYNEYAEKVLIPQIPPKVYARILEIEKNGDFENPEYNGLLVEHHYVHHLLRLPPDQWPDPTLRALKHINPVVYVLLQGPKELGLSGKLENWDRSNDLSKINVPVLTIGATHDTMDPAHMKWMAEQFPKGRYLHCENGSHLAFYDDQETYFKGMIQFLHDVDQGKM